MFQELEERDPQHLAVRQYKKYKWRLAKLPKVFLFPVVLRLAPI